MSKVNERTERTKMNKLMILAISIVGFIIWYFFFRKMTFKSRFGESSSEIAKVIIFYAPWCGHCKKAMNEFLKASQDPNVSLVNADLNRDIVDRYSVSGFPTIMRVSDGTVYSGSRKADDIIEFANKV